MWNLSKIDETINSLQPFEMTIGAPTKDKGIALKPIKEEFLSTKSGDDKKISKGEGKDVHKLGLSFP